jgi:hypothetical protein
MRNTPTEWDTYIAEEGNIGIAWNAEVRIGVGAGDHPVGGAVEVELVLALLPLELSRGCGIALLQLHLGVAEEKKLSVARQLDTLEFNLSKARALWRADRHNTTLVALGFSSGTLLQVEVRERFGERDKIAGLRHSATDPVLNIEPQASVQQNTPHANQDVVYLNV